MRTSALLLLLGSLAVPRVLCADEVPATASPLHLRAAQVSVLTAIQAGHHSQSASLAWVPEYALLSELTLGLQLGGMVFARQDDAKFFVAEYAATVNWYVDVWRMTLLLGAQSFFTDGYGTGAMVGGEIAYRWAPAYSASLFYKPVAQQPTTHEVGFGVRVHF